MSDVPREPTLDWDHCYILGAYDASGEPHLTTWYGDAPYFHAVLVGAGLHRVPYWNSAVPDGARLEPIPDGEKPLDFANRIGGVHVFGWILEKTIDRVPKSKDPSSGS